MAELSTLARPYAKAAFEHAAEAGDLQNWSDGLAVAAAVAQHDVVEKLLSSPTYTATQQAEKVITVCGDAISGKMNVVSAREISAEQQEKLASALSAKLERTVNMQVSIDSTLIGGAVVRAGDTVIDGSIRGRLSKLAEALHS